MPNIISSQQRPVVNNSIEFKEIYPMNDLNSVYTHYNPKTGKNEPTENKIERNGK